MFIKDESAIQQAEHAQRDHAVLDMILIQRFIDLKGMEYLGQIQGEEPENEDLQEFMRLFDIFEDNDAQSAQQNDNSIG